MHFPYKYATAIRIPPKKIPRNPSFLHIKYTFGKNKEKIKKKKKTSLPLIHHHRCL